MKTKVNYFVIPAVALGLAACKKEKAPSPDDTPVAIEAPAKAAPIAPSPDVTNQPLSPDERAAKLGFVKHLPKETEVVLAFHNGSKAASRLRSSKLWKLVQSEMGLEAMMGASPSIDNDEEDTPSDNTEPSGPAALFGTEFTIAMGKPTGAQTGNLLKLNSRSGYYQMRALAKAFVAAAKSGDISSIENAMTDQYGPQLLKDLLSDSEAGVDLFERLKMPPLYVAFRTSPSGRAAAAQQLASLVANLGMFSEIVEPITIEKNGQSFAGHKISGKKIAATMDKEGRSDMEEMLEPSDVDKLIAAVGKKDLLVLSGTIGDYVMLFLGSSTDDLVFASSPADSLVASDALAFSDAYNSKELAALIYGQKEAIDQMIAATNGLTDLANGLRDGLAGSDGLGDTRDLETLLRMVGEREQALRKLAGNETAGAIAFFEEGLKLESFGGMDGGAIDWNAPNQLASLGDSEDVLLFANMTSNAAYDEKARAYLEALMETAYAIATKIAEVPSEGADMKQFKEMTKLFDTQFRSDLVGMWDAFGTDFSESLGQESALVVDLSGSVPPIPGIPQAVADEAKFPRISMIAPVTDRAKLASSWEKINTSATNILAKVSKMAGEDIPMQKPISSEKDGYTTWFFSMPFFNNDFMPSVTVGDKWFAASSSKTQALDLINKADTSKKTRNGLYFAVNFKALQKFSTESLEIVKKNSDAIFGEGGNPESDLQDAAKIISTLDDLDSFTVHSRRESGKLRTSIHLKTR